MFSSLSYFIIIIVINKASHLSCICDVISDCGGNTVTRHNYSCSCKLLLFIISFTDSNCFIVDSRTNFLKQEMAETDLENQAAQAQDGKSPEASPEKKEDR